VPIAMIAASALSVVSTCVQGLASVERDETLWELAQDEIFAPKFAQYAAEEKAWEATDAGFRDAFRKAAKDGAPAEVDQKYLAHEMAKPKPPPKPDMLRMDDTPEAMAVALSHSHELGPAPETCVWDRDRAVRALRRALASDCEHRAAGADRTDSHAPA
jgi:hypothetical protein